MKNYRNSLPPLDYLLFFEAVARHGNFTRAAQELNVSQAAVSKRIKALEAMLALDLVSRSGRNVTLTPNGVKLGNTAREALDHLQSGVRQMRSITPEKLSLASNVAVSQYWLTPRINEYLIGRDAVPITLTTADRDADLFNQDNDVVIFYGADIPTGWDGKALFDEVWLPVAAPGLVAAARDVTGCTLLDFEKLTPKWVNWRDFIDLSGFTAFADAPQVKLGSYGSSLDAALRGKGLALGCAEILRSEFEAGRLVPLTDYQITTDRSYFVIWKTGQMTERTRELLRDIEIEI